MWLKMGHNSLWSKGHVYMYMYVHWSCGFNPNTYPIVLPRWLQLVRVYGSVQYTMYTNIHVQMYMYIHCTCGTSNLPLHALLHWHIHSSGIWGHISWYTVHVIGQTAKVPGSVSSYYSTLFTWQPVLLTVTDLYGAWSTVYGFTKNSVACNFNYNWIIIHT